MIANRCRLPVKEDFEGDTIILHFLSNGISPEGIAILFVQLKSFSDGLRHFNAKFVGPFEILWIPFLYEQDNLVPLFDDMRNPPVESWFMVNSNNFSMFGSLNGMRFLQVNEVFPGG